MSEAVTTTTGTRQIPATIRPYRPVDHRACRGLWAELTEHHGDLYDDPTIGGADAGVGFEEYLTRLDLTGLWVADHPEDGVVGMIGLLLKGRDGEVEPVVVTRRRRGRGIGTALLAHVAQVARRRGMTQLGVHPLSRNEMAIRCLHQAGYDALSSVTLTLNLDSRGQDRQEGLDLHGLHFRY